MIPSINTIHTSCKNCTYALYDNITQTNCALQYLDQYQQENLVIEAYDDDKEFYIINDKKCLGYREPKWFKQFDMEDASMEEKVNKFHATNKLHYLAVISLRNMSLENLDNICEQISNCDTLPQKIIFIRHQSNSDHFTYANIENIINKYNIKYAWRIQSMLDKELSDMEILHNIVVINPKYRFIVSIDNYDTNIKETINGANNIVHHKLESFIVASNQNYSCVVFGGGVYRFGVAGKENILANKSAYQII
jgi:hypothetical protein